MKKIFVSAVLAAGTVALQAQQYQRDEPMERTTAIQLSLTPDIALYPRDATVRGVSLNIWGENQQSGFTLGIVNGSTGDSKGFSWGIVNYDESYHGVQWGIVNLSRQEFVGWQRGIVNCDRGTFTGFQDGIVNVSEEARGFQLGLVNYAQELNGLQIGLINVAMNNPCFSDFPDKLAKGFPIVNWSF
ncbi:MAG TPA: hypothetical protein VIK59_12080 [Verrucomicrobiae bacterium]